MEGPPDKPESGGDEEERAKFAEKQRAFAEKQRAEFITSPKPSMTAWRAARDREAAAEQARAEAEAGASSAALAASAEPPLPPAGPPSPPGGPPGPPAESPEDKRRRQARTSALVTFWVVLPIALALVLSPLANHWREVDDGPFERRSETTVVTKVTAGGSPSTKVTVTQGPGTYTAGPSRGKPKKTTATETTKTGKATETTTAVSPAKDSLFVTALGNSGLLLVRIGIALLTAWVAAAAVQRAILGRFGVKVGPIEIAELPEVVVGLDGVRKLVDNLTVQVAELEKRLKPKLEPGERSSLEANLAQARAESEVPRQQVQFALDRLRDRSGPGNPGFE